MMGAMLKEKMIYYAAGQRRWSDKGYDCHCGCEGNVKGYAKTLR